MEVDWVMVVELQVPNDYVLDFAGRENIQGYHVREYLKRRLEELREEGLITHYHVLSQPRKVIA